jgi:hypothetical protein
VPLAGLFVLFPLATNELALVLPSLDVDIAASAGDFLVRAPVGAMAVFVEGGLAVEDGGTASGSVRAGEREKRALSTRGVGGKKRRRSE